MMYRMPATKVAVETPASMHESVPEPMSMPASRRLPSRKRKRPKHSFIAAAQATMASVAAV